RADRECDADVLVVGRGGGSLEDLQAFNEEVVARAIAACRTPVVSAVGHETDVSIADLVADARAATPSHAGEQVVPARRDLLARVDHVAVRLERALRRRLDTGWQRLEALADRPVLRDPARLLVPRRRAVEHLTSRLEAASPRAMLRARREGLEALAKRLAPATARDLARRRQRLDALGGRLCALSPLAVLARGYSLTLDEGGHVVRRAGDVAVGARIQTRLADGGRLASRVEDVRPAARKEETR
ncbi:MAG: exodeoxyribonuclease VII large subunit, partial [Planctomycetota bacterium]